MPLLVIPPKPAPSPPLPPTITRIDPIEIVLFPARIFLAFGWIRAGIEKLISGHWWEGTELQEFLSAQEEHMLPFLRPFADVIGTQTGVLLSLTILLVELIIGACLLTRFRIREALLAACALNIAFVAFGAVTPSAFYLVLQATLLFALIANRPVSMPHSTAAIGACTAGALALSPFIETVHPRDVIDDPAIMLATLALLVGATLTIRAVDLRSL